MKDAQNQGRIIVDTCVLMRALERNDIVFTYFQEFLESGKELLVTDKTLCELFNKLHDCRKIETLRRVLLVYNFKIIYEPIKIEIQKEEQKSTDKVYVQWLLEKENYKTLEEYVKISYFNTIVRFYTNLAVQIIIGLVDTLNADGKIVWKDSFFLKKRAYGSLADFFVPKKVGKMCNATYNNILINFCSLGWDEKELKEKCNAELIELINSMVAAFQLKDYEGGDIESVYQDRKKELGEKEKIGEICKKYIKEFKPLKKGSDMEDLDYVFFEAESEWIISNEYSNFFNDIIDFINFKWALKNHAIYYSFDSKFFKRLESQSEKLNCVEFISSSIEFSKEHEIEKNSTSC